VSRLGTAFAASYGMTRTRHWGLATAAVLCAASAFGPLLTRAEAVRTAGAIESAPGAPAADVAPPPAEIIATPSPRISGGKLPPILPPAGLPTAPPPDAIKPVEPQAGPGMHDLEPVGTRHNGGA
jgi:hypothetical protein